MNALISNSKGEIRELPDFKMLARSGDLYREALREEVNELPPHADISFLPGHQPIVWDKKSGRAKIWEETGKEKNFPSAAILPIGFLRTLLPACAPAFKKDFLPQWAYTALGMEKGKYVAAFIRIETSDQWENQYFNTPDLVPRVQSRLLVHSHNQIIKQLSICAQNYHCSTAQNIFYERWEGAIPVSPLCNAQCVGCISEQPRDLPPSSHERIKFSPSVEEILEIALPHLEKSPDPIISFGQGCEGEPLLAGEKIEKAILAVRARTTKGTLNINTNGSRPDTFQKLCRAGLDAVRISLNSAQKETYEAYYQPKGYGFEEVLETTQIAHHQGLAVSINLLTFPGITDREEEAEALIDFIHKTQTNAIQWRNLAIDPDQYLNSLPKRRGQILGIPKLLKILRKEFPKLHHLSFSRPKEFFQNKKH